MYIKWNCNWLEHLFKQFHIIVDYSSDTDVFSSFQVVSLAIKVAIVLRLPLLSSRMFSLVEITRVLSSNSKSTFTTLTAWAPWLHCPFPILPIVVSKVILPRYTWRCNKFVLVTLITYFCNRWLSMKYWVSYDTGLKLIKTQEKTTMAPYFYSKSIEEVAIYVAS